MSEPKFIAGQVEAVTFTPDGVEVEATVMHTPGLTQEQVEASARAGFNFPEDAHIQFDEPGSKKRLGGRAVSMSGSWAGSKWQPKGPDLAWKRRHQNAHLN